MSNNPTLSIVTPTLGKFSDFWWQSLLNIKGNVEFILVYPPGSPSNKTFDDPRIKYLICPYKGEMMQRCTGLINAKGKYVIALDDDDFLHPDVAELAEKYFNRFPDSWLLRLNKAGIFYSDEEKIKSPWQNAPDVSQLEICQKYEKGEFQGLLEIPIIPLTKKLDLRYVFLPFVERKDNYGYHFENFNNIIWKTEMVQKTLPKFIENTKVLGPITWMSSWGHDRLMGIFMQSMYFEEGKIVGHWMPKPDQIRFIGKDTTMVTPRFYIISDFLLVKGFPQFGYNWNLFLYELTHLYQPVGKLIKMKLGLGKFRK